MTDHLLNKEKLKNLYYTKLLPELVDVNKARIQLLLQSFMWGLLATLITCYFKCDTVICYILGLFILGPVYIGLGIQLNFYAYKRKYQTKVISQIIKLINPNYIYEPDKHITLEEFVDSNIFSKPSKITGDNCISYNHDDFCFKFSQIDASKVYGDKNYRFPLTIFKGLFFFAFFNKARSRATYILPDYTERYLGFLSSPFQKLCKSKGQLIKLANKDFEKYYAVYTNNEIEAKNILTPTVVNTLLDFRKKTKKRVYISCIQNKIHIAISHEKILFHPSVFSSVITFKKVHKVYNTFYYLHKLVIDLKLDRN